MGGAFHGVTHEDHYRYLLSRGETECFSESFCRNSIMVTVYATEDTYITDEDKCMFMKLYC